MLELARSGNLTLRKSEIDVSDLVRNAVETFRPLADDARIKLNMKIETRVIVKADPALLHQILSNLLSNAVKYTERNGRISVTLSKEALRISDTGIGIPTADLPHVFERFYQVDTSRSREGFGLGLSFVKQIADAHGFGIDVESTEKKGTTFTLLFGGKNRRNS